MAARGTRSLRPFTDNSCGMPLVLPTSRRHAWSSAAVAVSSAGTYQTFWPASFSRRKSVRALSAKHLHVLLDHGDERQKQRAVETVLVEIGRRHVRGRHHDDA